MVLFFRQYSRFFDYVFVTKILLGKYKVGHITILILILFDKLINIMTEMLLFLHFPYAYMAFLISIFISNL